MSVAALYIDSRGPYPKLLGAEFCWDKTRDARTYAGPWPVVAHPPCGPWGRLRHMYRGDEHNLAEIALEQVRRWGGVLEHPAHSLLWLANGSQYMAQPGEFPDAWGGWSIEVCQCDWGHPARKRTWLYLIGVPREAVVLPPPRDPTHWITGGRGRVGKKAKTTPVPPGIKVCSAAQRRRTPVAFAEWLIALARASREGSGLDGVVRKWKETT